MKEVDQAIERGEWFDIHDVNGVNPKNFDVLFPDVNNKNNIPCGRDLTVRRDSIPIEGNQGQSQDGRRDGNCQLIWPNVQSDLSSRREPRGQSLLVILCC